MKSFLLTEKFPSIRMQSEPSGSWMWIDLWAGSTRQVQREDAKRRLLEKACRCFIDRVSCRKTFCAIRDLKCSSWFAVIWQLE